MSQRYSTPQPQYQVDSDGFPIGNVVMKAKTKVRQDLSGNGTNRGILIIHPQTQQERWVSVPSDSAVAQADIGMKLLFRGKGNRPSLTMPNNTQIYNDNGPVQMSQYNANRYARQAESVYHQVENGMYPQNQQNEIDYNHYEQNNVNSDQPRSSENNIDERLLERNCLILANAVNLMKSLSPQLDEDNIVKLAISASIAYEHQMKDRPF